MNVTLEQNIVVRLHQLDDSRLRDVLAFVESLLAAKPTTPKMMGLLSHLHVDNQEVEQALLDVKAEHQATASHLMGQL